MTRGQRRKIEREAEANGIMDIEFTVRNFMVKFNGKLKYDPRGNFIRLTDLYKIFDGYIRRRVDKNR